jgi:hypothetical protein
MVGGLRKSSPKRSTQGLIEPLERRLLLAAGPVNPYVIDLLVVYTTQAKVERGGDAVIQALIQSAVDSTNQALYNSQIPVTIRLVHSEEVN